MQVELKTRTRITRDGEPELILSWTILPRGSGNRRKVRELAAAVRQHQSIATHITKMTTGSTRLTIHFRASLELMRAFWTIDQEARDVPGQLPLFESVKLA